MVEKHALFSTDAQPNQTKAKIILMVPPFRHLCEWAFANKRCQKKTKLFVRPINALFALFEIVSICAEWAETFKRRAKQARSFNRSFCINDLFVRVGYRNVSHRIQMARNNKQTNLLFYLANKRSRIVHRELSWRQNIEEDLFAVERMGHSQFQ